MSRPRVRVDLELALDDYFEAGSGVRVELLDEPRAFAAIDGRLVFDRSGRHLVMLVEPVSGPYVQRVACAYSATIAIDEGELVLRRLELREDPDPRSYYAPFEGVTSAILRATRPDALLALVIRTLQGEQALLGRLLELDAERPPAKRLFTKWIERQRVLTDAIALVAPDERHQGRGGRPPLGEDHYRRVALECLELYGSGAREGILDEIARRYGRDPRTVADWIRKARHLGFLVPGQPGRLHFAAGPRLFDPTQTSSQRRRRKGGKDG